MRLFQLVSTFWAALARDRPFSHSPLVVGVSGGPDSLALLHLLHRLLPANRLVVAHLDHGLRPEAAADARFVAETAAAWGMACVIQAVDVAALAAQQQLSLEAAGRQARYAFFARVAQQAGAEMVAVGHNADDQAETVLMHLIRGAGPAGLRGMQPVSPLVGVPGVWLLRPLLNAPRAAIDAYCHAHDLQPRHDLTNQDPRFFRNRIRHELLPLLESYNPGIHSGLLQLASILTAEDALLQAQQLEAWQTLLVARGADWLRLDRSGWRALPVALQRRLLRHAVAQLRPDVSDVPFDAVEQARLLAESADTGAASVLPGGLVLRVAYETIFIGGGDPVLAPGPQLEDEARRLPIPGVLTLANGWQLRAAPAAEAGLGSARDNDDPWQAFVDVGERAALTVRARQPGERLQPLGMNGRSTPIKAIMINRKIPQALRARWPIVATEAHPVWLVGHVLDHRARVTAEGNGLVHVRCLPPEDTVC